MSARFLLDANALSEPARPRPDPKFMHQFELHRHALATAAPAWHEVLHGVEAMPAGRKRDAIESYLLGTLLPTLEVLPYDEAAARWHARERARLRASGWAVPFADGLVAAVARRHDLPLVTNNLKDFAGFAGLRAISWIPQGKTVASD